MLACCRPGKCLECVSIIRLSTMYHISRGMKPCKFFQSRLALCSFMLGYHVHEKAVLAVSIPAALTAVASKRAAGEYLFLIVISTYALFPLLQGMAEYPVKVGTKPENMQNGISWYRILRSNSQA